MTDELQTPRWRDGERKNQIDPNRRESQDESVNSLEQVSLAAVIQILIQRGLCTEAELLAEEIRQRSTNVSDARLRTSDSYFTPVQTHSERERHRHRRADDNRLRRWAAQYSWSRKVGGLLFGWKWHRKKSEQKI